jgi:hypothetical protein
VKYAFLYGASCQKRHLIPLPVKRHTTTSDTPTIDDLIFKHWIDVPGASYQTFTHFPDEHPIKTPLHHPFTIIAEDQTTRNINGYNNALSAIHIDWNITWCRGNVIVLMHSNDDNEHVIDARHSDGSLIDLILTT